MVFILHFFSVFVSKPKDLNQSGATKDWNITSWEQKTERQKAELIVGF